MARTWRGGVGSAVRTLVAAVAAVAVFSCPPAHSMSGVTAVDHDDVWASGFASWDTQWGSLEPATFRWDAGRWTAFRTALGWTDDEYLADIDGATPDDVWAVGSNDDGGEYDPGRLHHWNGTAWSLSWAPMPGALYAVDARAPDDVWTVGAAAYYDDSRPATVSAHWDGTRWTSFPPKNLHQWDYYNQLSGVAAIGADEAWAVGFSSGPDVTRPLIQRWDGAQWTRISNPTIAARARLEAVDGATSDDVWAVGERRFVKQGTVSPLIEHWDGTAWSVVSTPITSGTLTDVVAVSHDDVWAVGNAGDEALLMHWDGAAWTRMPAPALGVPGGRARLESVDAASGDDIWAVGRYTSANGRGEDLALHWDGNQWTASPALPDTKITVQPATAVEAATFEFASNTATSFECALDGGDWQPCASPSTYTALADGYHRLLVRARDAAENVDPSPEFASFTVLNVRPTVTLVAPAPDSTLTGTVTLSAEASDNIGVTRVKWFLDGVEIASTSRAPWSRPWQTESVADGRHRLIAKARDAAGNWGTSPSVYVTVDNRPD